MNAMASRRLLGFVSLDLKRERETEREREIERKSEREREREREREKERERERDGMVFMTCYVIPSPLVDKHTRHR